jgi:hypothetical protein
MGIYTEGRGLLTVRTGYMYCLRILPTYTAYVYCLRTGYLCRLGATSYSYVMDVQLE